MTSLGDFAESTIQPACPSRDIPTSRRNDSEGSAMQDLGKSHYKGRQISKVYLCYKGPRFHQDIFKASLSSQKLAHQLI
jgi:hypothetical protein